MSADPQPRSRRTQGLRRSVGDADGADRRHIGSSPTRQPETERAEGIQVIARATNVLRHLAGGPDGLSIAQLAGSLGLPRSTTHRIVQALTKEGLAREISSGRYVLGPELMSLAFAGHRGLRSQLSPHVQQLSTQLGETVDLAVLSDADVLFIDQHVSRQTLQVASQVGARFPAHCTASGKALLATLPRWRVERLLPWALPPLTPRTITSRRAMLEELDRIGRSGVAYDFEEHSPGIIAVAVAITDHCGETAALSVVVPSARYREREDLEEALLGEWRDIQSELGHPEVSVAGQAQG